MHFYCKTVSSSSRMLISGVHGKQEHTSMACMSSDLSLIENMGDYLGQRLSGRRISTTFRKWKLSCSKRGLE